MALKPDIIVGVDFGMTGTGVAYSVAPEWARPEVIQSWPGNTRGTVADKVDSKISYDLRSGQLAAWGFFADFTIRHHKYTELFKLYLDPEFNASQIDAPSLEEARKWFRDFLSCLYKEVMKHLKETIPRVQSRKIEFCFSVPTTWKDPAMVAEHELLIRQAGFGSEVHHTARITLTEAEAAAVYASKHQYQKGDVFLICDAGGGTTDVNVLKVAAQEDGQTELEPLSWVEGQPIGSTLIDFKVEILMRERLRRIHHKLPDGPDNIARNTMRESSRFETFKRNYGSESFSQLYLTLPISCLPPGFDDPDAHIENSMMVISKEDLEKIFDQQVSRIVRLLEEQLQTLQHNHPTETINYLVLSGGLGSSPYLYQRLKSHFELGAHGSVNTQNLTILKADKPQLAVVRGLVMDRVQEIISDRNVYVERCCRSSYGVVARHPYNPMFHQGEPVSEDPRDKRRWAEQQIDWFIKQGDKVSVKQGIKQHYRLKLDPGREQLPWKTQIVMSALPVHSLPTSMRMDGATTVCALESVPDYWDLKLKNRHWYNFKPKYYRAEFDVQVLVGSADLKFQVLGRNGALSKKHDDISVRWTNSTKQQEPARERERPGDEFGLYRF
ncbi:hypothetical protein LTR84_006671 [Exophiala bonariae]|uniref:Hsp70 family chaperone n=1 Tax=Exophiala bonariae TaxID=1690606 RepID=A0AAV9N0Y9_9EURO|nr:hypothetical protein LTR84_006671 [Exophiala bonariae]